MDSLERDASLLKFKVTTRINNRVMEMATNVIPPTDAAPLIDQFANNECKVFQINTNEEDAVRLKRMGICVGRRVRLIQAGDPLIVRVVGCRVGISRRLAASILVTPEERC